MLSRTASRWLPAVFVACVAVFEAVMFLVNGDVVAAVLAVLLLGLAWWISPLRVGPTTPHHLARRRHAEDGTVVIYWRPGCRYCQRLWHRLGRARREAVWVNIWVDDEAAEFVREHNGGDETVPTVLIGDRVLTAPDPAVVRRAVISEPAA